MQPHQHQTRAEAAVRNLGARASAVEIDLGKIPLLTNLRRFRQSIGIVSAKLISFERQINNRRTGRYERHISLSKYIASSHEEGRQYSWGGGNVRTAVCSFCLPMKSLPSILGKSVGQGVFFLAARYLCPSYLCTGEDGEKRVLVESYRVRPFHRRDDGVE